MSGSLIEVTAGTIRRDVERLAGVFCGRGGPFLRLAGPRRTINFAKVRLLEVAERRATAEVGGYDAGDGCGRGRFGGALPLS